MISLLIVGALLIIVFSFVVFFGAPFLPTLSARVNDAIDLLNLKKGQTLLELGSGDGRLLKAAAERGIKGVGYELNPLLVIWSRIINRKHRKLITVKWANYWSIEWPETDGIYVFLLNPYMKKLNNKVIQTYNGRNIRLVSFAFKIPGKNHAQEKDGLYLYLYGNNKK
jgi:hypothetical protein